MANDKIIFWDGMNDGAASDDSVLMIGNAKTKAPERITVKKFTDDIRPSLISKKLDNSETHSPSGAAVTAIIKGKADVKKADGSSIVYADKNGLIDTASIALANSEKPGLLSPAKFNFINDMENNLNALIQAITGDMRFNSRLDIFCDIQQMQDSKLYAITNAAEFKQAYDVYTKDTNTVAGPFTGSNLSFGILATTQSHISSFLSDSDEGLGSVSIKKYSSDIHSIKLSCTKGFNALSLTSSKVKILDLSGALVLFYYSGGWCPSLSILDASNCTKCKGYVSTNCSILTAATINVQNATEAYFSDCPKLEHLTFIGTSSHDLAQVNLRNTIVKADDIEKIEEKWSTRVGKSQGVLVVSKTLYDELSSDLLMKFVNKNINVKFA